MSLHYRSLLRCFLWLCLAGWCAMASAERIKEISTVAGMRPNQLVGYGLVVGLDNSGDMTTQTPFTIHSLNSMLLSLGVTVPPNLNNGGPGGWSSNSNIQLRNVAAVMVTAELPTNARPGQAVDVTVSAIGNSRSLRGGTLLMTPLKAADGNVYAQAQGSVVVSGLSAMNRNVRVSVNHQSAGVISSGALVERAIPVDIPSEFVQLDLKQSDFAMVQRVSEIINRAFGAGTALPLDSRSMNVRTPQDQAERVQFMARLEELNVNMVPASAKVVLNSRSGSVVMNQSVKLAPFAVAHGNISVRVERSNLISQPNPLSFGRTAIASSGNVSLDQGKVDSMRYSQGGANLEQVVRALNILGATPQDLISIVQAIKASGALAADVEVQ